MLLDKKSWCFRCHKPTWVVGKFERARAPFDMTYVKIDECTSCGCSKRTTEYGTIEYLDAYGVETNFMLHDYRHPCNQGEQNE